MDVILQYTPFKNNIFFQLNEGKFLLSYTGYIMYELSISNLLVDQNQIDELISTAYMRI